MYNSNQYYDYDSNFGEAYYTSSSGYGNSYEAEEEDIPEDLSSLPPALRKIYEDKLKEKKLQKQAENEMNKKIEEENNVKQKFEEKTQNSSNQTEPPMTLLSDTIYVSGLPQEITEEQFLYYFAQVGAIHFINGNYKYKLYRDEKGVPKGDGTITYEYPASATLAIQWFNNQYWGNNQMHVEFAQAKYNPLENSVVDNNNNVIGAKIPNNIFKNSQTDSNYGEVLRGRGRAMPLVLSIKASKPIQENAKPVIGSTTPLLLSSLSSSSSSPAVIVNGKNLLDDKDNWTCPNPACKNVNFARRMKCHRCGMDKPEDLYTAQQKEKYLKNQTKYGPGDWLCISCSNMNFKNRTRCHHCHAEKPPDLGVRDGKAGGFNERDENIEKIHHSESDDDEYDDFGRKKKKYRVKHQSNDKDDSEKRSNSPSNRDSHNNRNSSSLSRHHHHHSHHHSSHH